MKGQEEALKNQQQSMERQKAALQRSKMATIVLVVVVIFLGFTFFLPILGWLLSWIVRR